MKMLRKKSKHVHVLNCLMVDDDVFEDDLASYCNLSLFCLFYQLTLDKYTLMVIDKNHYWKELEKKKKMKRG